MTQTTGNPWLGRFACATAAATFLLVGLGGLVTSHGAGMAVPDWPTTYGYNMFLFPPSYWVGGVFYEHTHRLLASLVGLLTTLLAVWLWRGESRRWLRWVGVGAWVGVVLQGLLGGLRVTLYKDQIGIFHAALAQVFLVVVTAIALFTTRWWRDQPGTEEKLGPGTTLLRRLLVAAVLLVFAQLVLGASMRHQHAGLAIPDFPLAYGKLWPSTDAASLDAINRTRLDTRDQNPITAAHILLHMVHRIGALLTVIVTGVFAWKARRQPGLNRIVSRMAGGWFGLMMVQGALGVATVLSNKAADVATGHVMVGAASLVLGCLIYLVLFRVSEPVSVTKRLALAPSPPHAVSPSANFASSL